MFATVAPDIPGTARDDPHSVLTRHACLVCAAEY